VVTLVCPPLRDRAGDIALLARAFLGDREIEAEALDRIAVYAWPGNVRELRNVCERCTVLARAARIAVDDLPLEVRLGSAASRPPGDGPVRTLKEMERVMVVRALDATGGVRTKAAKLLGITYPTLKKKIDEFGL
jgi:DNA-binding NtrC family response regulator